MSTSEKQWPYKECNHPHQEIRYRQIKGAKDRPVKQCLICGRHLESVKREYVPLRVALDKPAFDEKLREAGWQRESQVWSEQRQQRQEEESVEWWRNYEEHLNSPEWAWRRQAVLERAGDCCEGCRKRRAVHVHHLSYDHVGHELLFELVAVCGTCHHVLHPHLEETVEIKRPV